MAITQHYTITFHVDLDCDDEATAIEQARHLILDERYEPSGIHVEPAE